MQDEKYEPPPLFVMPTKFAAGWDGQVDDEGRKVTTRKSDGQIVRLRILDLAPVGNAKVWRQKYPQDAHCTMYHFPGEPQCFRLRKSGLLSCSPQPVLTWIIVDVDTPGHVPLSEAPAKWLAQIEAAQATIPEMAYCISWKSKGGYKFAWPLATKRQFLVDRGEDYLGMYLDYLFYKGLPVDQSCKDWTRMMRMPNAKREGDPNSWKYKVMCIGLKPLDWEPPREPCATPKHTPSNRRSGNYLSDSGTPDFSRDMAKHAAGQYVNPEDPEAWIPVLNAIPANLPEPDWMRLFWAVAGEYGDCCRAR
ncbi:MAG: hypothetical protein H0U74_18310 [Bradymonadaceae bacterium]|nr:hypothetical protein [Lujinxingiaceae bacterium]